MLANTFDRIFSIGPEYQAFQAANGDGFLHRLGGINRLFYTRHFSEAVQLLKFLAFEGVGALRAAAPAGSPLFAVWDEMSRLGFFFNSDPVPPHGFVWRVSQNGGMMANQVRAYQTAFQVFNDSSPRFHALIADADAIAPLCKEIECTAREIVPPPPFGAAGQPPPSICIISSLCGGESAAAEIVNYLERSEAPLIFEADLGDSGLRNPILRRLEAEGFLPGVRAEVGVETLLEERLRSVAIRSIVRWLEEQPGREVFLRFQRPARFGSVDKTRRYFEGIETCFDELLGFDVDLTNLSIVQRACRCLLHSRSTDCIFEATADVEGGIMFWHYFDGDCLAHTVPSIAALTTFSRRLLELTSRPEMDGIYGRFRPANFIGKFQQPSDVGISEQSLVAELQRHLWHKLFDWLFGELLRISRENAELGTPLRLDITSDRQARYAPLYQKDLVSQ